MNYDSVSVTTGAMRIIRSEMRKVIVTETGGALVGRLDGRTLRVHAACGPGPRGALSYWTVLVDGNHATKFCNRYYDNTNGRIDYVGDWHCHLGWSLTPSGRDRQAMETMAPFARLLAQNPVSLIFARWSRRWKAFRYCGRLIEIHHSIEDNDWDLL